METGYKIIINNTFMDNMPLLEFISHISNTRYRLIPTAYRYEGEFNNFFTKFTHQSSVHDNLSFATYFKYLLAIYNNVFEKRLRLRHSKELTEEESVDI